MDNVLWQNVFNVRSAGRWEVGEEEKECLSFNCSHPDQSRAAAATTPKFLIVLNVRCLCRPRPRKEGVGAEMRWLEVYG